MATLVRKLDASGDYSFGRGPVDFLTGAAATAQCAVTALRLIAGEWFLDITAGVRWWSADPAQQTVFGAHVPQAFVESEIKTALLRVPGMAQLLSFVFTPNRQTRRGAVSAAVLTVDGDIQNISVAVSP
jgi:hypothetical protein